MGARRASSAGNRDALDLGDVVLALCAVEAPDLVRSADLGTLRAARAGGETAELTPQQVAYAPDLPAAITVIAMQAIGNQAIATEDN